MIEKDIEHLKKDLISSLLYYQWSVLLTFSTYILLFDHFHVAAVLKITIDF